MMRKCRGWRTTPDAGAHLDVSGARTAPSVKRPLTAGNACEILGHMSSVAYRVYDWDGCVADADASGNPLRVYTWSCHAAG